MNSVKIFLLTVLLFSSCSNLPSSASFEVEKGTSKVELKHILINEYPTDFSVSADLRGGSRHVASSNSRGRITIKVYTKSKEKLLYEEEKLFSTASHVKNSKKRFYTKVSFNPKDKHIVFRVDSY